MSFVAFVNLTNSRAYADSINTDDNLKEVTNFGYQAQLSETGPESIMPNSSYGDDISYLDIELELDNWAVGYIF